VTGAEVTLAAGALRATFIPELAMVGRSLTHAGVEVLGLRDGPGVYRERGATFGIPLLHPWANRLVRPLPASDLIPHDEHGLPIHGVLPRVLPFQVTESSARSVRAEFDTHDHPAVLEVFPHPHTLTVVAALDDEGLEIRTTLRAHGRRPCPVSFGYHPYLCLPDVPRAEWSIEVPARTRIVLDERGIPTGDREPVTVAPGPLGARTFDDGYTDLGAAPRFTVSGGGRTLAVEFLEGYEYAQVYAPAGHDLIAYEPMTAPTNALASGDDLQVVRPGESYSAAFRITVA
jgi:galactose mutarotase-like enzyme